MISSRDCSAGCVLGIDSHGLVVMNYALLLTGEHSHFGLLGLNIKIINKAIKLVGYLVQMIKSIIKFLF